MTRRIEIFLNGHPVQVREGIPLAVALIDLGVPAFRLSPQGEPRSPICGMGVCFECRVTIGGRAHQRSCLVPCRAGLVVETGQA